MYDKMVKFLYGVQVLSQAVVCLVTPIAIGTLGAWLLVRHASVDTWIYAVFILVGTLMGLWSMVRFLLKVSAQLLVIEQAAEKREKERRRANEEAHAPENADVFTSKENNSL